MNRERILECLLIGIVLYFIFFLRLDASWIRPWDEAIYSINAYEMGKNGNFIVPFIDGHPDFLNSKPPLQIWVQVLFIKVLGFNEMAVRLPSAICGVLCAILLFVFLKRNFGKIWAWSSFFVLATSNGFVNFHTARTAEMDSMLTLFLFLTTVSLFRILMEENNKNKNIFLYFVFLTLAFLAKSFASLLFLPAHFILFLVYKKFKQTVFSLSFFTGLLLFGIFGIGFAFLRERYQPGYIDYILSHDFGRVNKVIEEHNAPFDFYFNNFFYQRFSIWIWTFVIGIALLFLNEKCKKIKTICFASIVSVVTYLLIISLSTTKLEWYDMPLYPLLAIVAGYACWKFLELFLSGSFSYTKQMGIIFLVFSIPTYYAIKNSHDQSLPVGEKKMQRLAEYVFKKEKEGFDFNDWLIIDKWQNGQLLFYKYKLVEKNQIINFVDENNLKKGDRILLMDEEAKKIVESKYEFKIIDTFNEVTAYEILNVKLL